MIEITENAWNHTAAGNAAGEGQGIDAPAEAPDRVEGAESGAGNPLSFRGELPELHSFGSAAESGQFRPSLPPGVAAAGAQELPPYDIGAGRQAPGQQETLRERGCVAQTAGEAELRQITPGQYRAYQDAGESAVRQQIENDPLYRQLAQEVQLLRRKDQERVFSEDLKSVREAHPEVTAARVEELGEAFLQARILGMDAVTAYELAAAKAARETPAPPPTVGAQSAPGGEKEFYTSAELDRLTGSQLDNPEILQKAVRSISRLR